MSALASARCTSNDDVPLPYPPTRLPALGVALAMLAIATTAGCGDDAANGSGGGDAGSPTGSDAGSSVASGGGGDDANTPPTADGATEIVLDEPIREGASIEVPVAFVDAEGDTFTVEATFAPFVGGALEDGSLSMHVGYRAEADVPGAPEVLATVVARDARGAELSLPVRGTVDPLRWSDATEWTSEGPEAREHGTVLVDEASGSIYVMFGSGYAPYLEPLGDAWRFDVAAGTWTEVTLDGDVPPPGGSKRIGGLHGSGEGWIYGGYGEDNEAFGGVYHVVADGDALHFEELEQENPPGGRLLHAFGYDPGTETFAMFGGGSTVLEGDTWTMQIVDGVATWTEIAGPGDGGPSPRFGSFFGMDQERGRLVVFSGQTSFSNVFGDDTWVLDLRADPPTWSEVTPAEGPPGRRNGTSVWDPSASRFFVFGGTSDGATTQPGLFVLDARPGHEAWTLVEREGEPPLRSSGFGAAFDGAVWMGFGNSSSGVFEDFTRLGHEAAAP